MGNDQKLNDLFAKAKGQKSKLTFEETATVFKSSLSMSKSATKFKVFTFKNSAIMLGIVGIILTSISLLMGNNGEMDSDPNIRKALPSQDEFNEVYRKVKVEAESNLNLYEIYVSENGISWSKVDSFRQS